MAIFDVIAGVARRRAIKAMQDELQQAGVTSKTTAIIPEEAGHPDAN